MTDGRKNNRGTVGNKGGNRGYGKKVFLENKVNEFSPLFWDEMNKMINSKNKTDKKFAMTEFNKIQIRMVPDKKDIDARVSNLNEILDECEK